MADADTAITKGCPLMEELWNRPRQRSTQPVLPTHAGPEFDKLVNLVEADREETIDASAFRGDCNTNFRLAARNVHLLTRSFYSDMMMNIGHNIHPMMLLSDADDGVPGGLGGMITVYFANYSFRRYVPTPPTYELLKNLSHMTLGVFAVVSPWFRCPGGLEPEHASVLLDKARMAHRAAKLATFPDNEKRYLETAKAMYGIVERYLEKWIVAGTCSVTDFEAFAQEMNKYVPNNIKEAATIQANALYPVLKQIKEDMGAEWKKLYVVVPSVWPVAGLNPRVEIISRLMEPDQVNTRVFVLDNVSTMAQYRQTLGRIIGDRCSANLIFGSGTNKEEKEKMLYALSTRQDLMANACDEAMKEIEKKEKEAVQMLLGTGQLDFENKHVKLGF